MWAAVYPGLPADDETLCRFYAMLNLVPDAVKMAWGYSGDEDLDASMERMEREAEQMARLEGLGD